MRRIFADTFYWIAITDLGDAWHERALEVSLSLNSCHLVTTESVLIEYVNFFSHCDVATRRAIVQSVHSVLDHPHTEVVRQTRGSLLSGMGLYASRPDKQYSLTDCISMQVMREYGIFEVLTHDAHFAQEGFVALLR